MIMETKMNSTFLTKVNEFTEDIRKEVKTEERKAIIVIASEQNEEKTGSKQVGVVCGNEFETVIALAGFILKPHGQRLLMKALEFIEQAETCEKDIEEEQEEQE